MNEELTNTLNEWAKELNVEPGALQHEAEVIEEELKNRGREVDNTYILKRIQKRRKAMKHLRPFKGFFLGKSPVVDLVEDARKAAMEQYKKDPEIAKALDIVIEENGVVKPLWSTKTCRFLSEDDNRIGKVMPEHLWAVTAGGIVLTGDGYRPMRYRAGGEEGVKSLSTLEDNTWYTFEALDRFPKNQIKDLRASKYTTYLPIQGNDILEVLNSEDLAPFYTNLVELNAAINDKKFLVLVRCYASSIGRKPTRTGNYVIKVDDVSTGMGEDAVTSWVPPTIPLDFGVGSDLILLANPRFGKGSNNIEGTSVEEEIPQLNVYGLYVVNREPIGEEE